LRRRKAERGAVKKKVSGAATVTLTKCAQCAIGGNFDEFNAEKGGSAASVCICWIQSVGGGK
jgi:hypothetical protein